MIEVLDHGYVRFVEGWGSGDCGVPEAGIIEAARQSTQGNFRQWAPYELCEKCGTWRSFAGVTMWEAPGFCRPYDDHSWKKYPRGDVGLLAFLNDNKHSTPFEFAGMVIEVKAPITVFREWHRHRTQSYNEMSARYAPLPDTNYMPTPERCMMIGGKNRQAGAVAGADELTHEMALAWLEDLSELYAYAEACYQRGLKVGVPKELARLCLPVGRYSQMRASANLRNWLAFLTLRMDPAAQWEIRMFANAVGNIIAEKFPRTWALFSNKGNTQ